MEVKSRESDTKQTNKNYPTNSTKRAFKRFVEALREKEADGKRNLNSNTFYGIVWKIRQSHLACFSVPIVSRMLFSSSLFNGNINLSLQCWFYVHCFLIKFTGLASRFYELSLTYDAFEWIGKACFGWSVSLTEPIKVPRRDLIWPRPSTFRIFL